MTSSVGAALCGRPDGRQAACRNRAATQGAYGILRTAPTRHVRCDTSPCVGAFGAERPWGRRPRSGLGGSAIDSATMEWKDTEGRNSSMIGPQRKHLRKEPVATRRGATIIDLYRVPESGKAELVDGEIVLMSPTGGLPGRAAGRIYRSLDDYERSAGGGYAFPDNVGFTVNLPHRRSFSPDAAFYVGELKGGQFLDGAPAFAVEVRSEGDYGARAEREMAAKRADYFAAGTLVVWDVDVLKEKVVRVYRASDPQNPAVYRSGDAAEAEPALPGWTMSVDDLLP